MRKTLGIVLIAIAAAYELYFMHLITIPIIQGFLSCLKTLGV